MSFTTTIDQTFRDFDVAATVDAVTYGARVDLYAIATERRTSPDAVTKLGKTLALRLGQEELRFVVPIPGTTMIGLEVPNETPAAVAPWALDHTRAPLTVPIGEAIGRDTVNVDLASLPHLLVAGATGQGKSTALNAMLSTVVSHPDYHARVRLTLIDPKRVEFAPYDSVADVHTETEDIVDTLANLVREMDDTYDEMRDAGVRNHVDLHHGGYYNLVVVDELADLIMTDKRAEKFLVKLAQKGRAAGFHLVLATQRPDRDVVTGLLKANIPARLALSVTSTVNSMVILDQPGASALTGKGDALFLSPGQRRPVRVQVPLFTDEDVQEAVRVSAGNRPGRRRRGVALEVETVQAWNGKKVRGRKLSDAELEREELGL